MRRTVETVKELSAGAGPEADQDSQYAIPLAFRKRTLFKMDFAEVVYISELQTSPAGHISYRNVAYAMYEAVACKYPALARYLRVHDMREAVDLLKRWDKPLSRARTPTPRMLRVHHFPLTFHNPSHRISLLSNALQHALGFLEFLRGDHQ